MRITALMVFVLLLCSCSSHVKYYEYYERPKTKGFVTGNNYSVLEVRKDKMIYRSSLYGYGHGLKNDIIYLYVELKNEGNGGTIMFRDFEKFKILFDDMRIEEGALIPTLFDGNTMIEFFQGSIEPTYELYFSDKLTLKETLQFPIYSKVGNSYQLLSNKRWVRDYHFDNMILDQSGIWFPSKLKRIKKIDYSFFNVSKDLIDKVESDSIKSSGLFHIIRFKIIDYIISTSN